MACNKYNKLLKFCFVFILIHLFFRIESFASVELYAHSSVIVENKLYFFGGENGTTCTNKVLFLGIINSGLPSWTHLTLNSEIGFRSCWATTVAVNDKNNNPIIYLIGGSMLDQNNSKDVFTSLVHSFNPKNGKWDVPIITGKKPSRREEIQAVSDGFGNIYVFGGSTENLGYKFVSFNDMVILHTNDLTWSYGTTDNSPLRRELYTATLLSNGMIVYIGGYEYVDASDELGREVNINKINLYDTKENKWSVMQARNDDQIQSRYGHSAVLVHDGKIIIYGGVKGEDDDKSIKAIPDLAVLNTETNPFEWTVPQLSSYIDEYPSLAYHTANLVRDFMIVAFGRITNLNGLSEPSLSNKIYLLDTKYPNNYIWVDKLEPKSISASNTTTTASNPKNTDGKKNTIIVATISGILGAAILMTFVIMCYRWYQKRNQKDVSGCQ